MFGHEEGDGVDQLRLVSAEILLYTMISMLCFDWDDILDNEQLCPNWQCEQDR